MSIFISLKLYNVINGYKTEIKLDAGIYRECYIMLTITTK